MLEQMTFLKKDKDSTIPGKWCVDMFKTKHFNWLGYIHKGNPTEVHLCPEHNTWGLGFISACSLFPMILGSECNIWQDKWN
jgi:hypothetical protein